MCFHYAINKQALSLVTGLILRRCSLDAVGLASWENPTYIKCVSKNYENIQLLVRISVIKMLDAFWRYSLE